MCVSYTESNGFKYMRVRECGGTRAHLRNGKQPLSFKSFLCFANMRNAMHKLDFKDEEPWRWGLPGPSDEGWKELEG